MIFYFCADGFKVDHMNQFYNFKAMQYHHIRSLARNKRPLLLLVLLSGDDIADADDDENHDNDHSNY